MSEPVPKSEPAVSVPEPVAREPKSKPLFTINIGLLAFVAIGLGGFVASVGCFQETGRLGMLMYANGTMLHSVSRIVNAYPYCIPLLLTGVGLEVFDRALPKGK